jgi:hypothetical protein
MARSKTPRAAARKTSRRKQASGKGSRPSKTAARARRKTVTRRAASPRKPAARKRTRQKSAKARASASRRVSPRTRVKARRAAAAKGSARKVTPRKVTARKVAGQTKTVRKAPAPKTAAKAAVASRKLPRPAATVVPLAGAPAKAKGRTKKPALDRERRRLPDADLLPSLPSSLDFDGHASAARSGHVEIMEELAEHTETSPSLTGGDVDADWQQAYSSGDEAPGGDNPTPDQDIVDEIGRSLGLEYDDDEELKGAGKIEERDRHRWELDPASSEDFEER